MKELINRIFEKNFVEANNIIQRISGIVDYFSSDEEKDNFVSDYNYSTQLFCENRSTYGDWQTPADLARKICYNHLRKFGSPDVVIEPTCGKGAFVKAALNIFPDLSELYAIEINKEYTADLKYSILSDSLAHPKSHIPNIYILNTDFFSFDFTALSHKVNSYNWNIAIIGNPPWVTNSHQGKFDSKNVPAKTNKYHLKGIDALTGKSNFDISEHIVLSLLCVFDSCNGGISILLKNSVIRNIISKQLKHPKYIYDIKQEQIDASKEFDVSVEASCLSAKLGGRNSLLCEISDFYSHKSLTTYGWVNEKFVADIDVYRNFSQFDGHSSYEWRSGIKHDCAAVLELTLINEKLINSFGEVVDVENDSVYPLLKSSDINKSIGQQRKYIIVPQHKIGENTANLKYTQPKLYEYLERYAELFDKRKSSIYKGKNKFSIFGVGDYSFKPFKIVISSLYKNLSFVLVQEHNGKPIIIDDTCYQLGFDSLEEAKSIYAALMSFEIQSLLKSLVFMDAKRVVTKSLLMRLDLTEYCKVKGFKIAKSNSFLNDSTFQLSLFDEA